MKDEANKWKQLYLQQAKQNDELREKITNFQSHIQIFDKHIEERWQMGALPDWATLKEWLFKLKEVLY